LILEIEVMLSILWNSIKDNSYDWIIELAAVRILFLSELVWDENLLPI
jgi:hypothetical protein